ncbi:hypothetical protein JDV02_001485 [Purpureocillium takamizusanense]|uniref:Pre-mRNA splicing factor CLF1 n=1 Tax=Purpureocillium takamizusanense TaxID=2060973 RepID=A0A9Q8Q909_9HYPO|nr:uncharacterized protein JDV02_001485 [Purpureocillium takamizusanense]UNI14906.1 hypothetical protein JDV02_001485 [Purpureocillium takamizusanense]
MPAPKPPASLDNSCTVIHDNTLYSFTPDSFLSIALENSAKWKKLQPGVKVTGASCVGTTPSDVSQAGFYVVGGKSDVADYSGLQKYTYSTGNWTTVPITEVQIKNRQGHSSTYIQADDAILLYGGGVGDARGASTTTFTIGASAPWTVRSYGSVIAPPAVSPILMKWSGADAAMIGGGADPQNAKVWLFNPNAKWRDSGASLADPLAKDTSSMQAVLIDGDDGSKSLYTFDLSQSPNTVSRFTLQGTDGVPVHASTRVTARSVDGAKSEVKRGLSLNDWPKYNASLAPTTTRQNFAMAQGPDGMVVFSGGNSDSPLAIFNAKENGWMNVTALLGDNTQKAMTASTTTTSTSSTTTAFSSTSTTPSTSTTMTSTATSSAAALPPTAPSTDSGPSSDAILGITLGTIAGFLALLGLILLLLRRHKKQRNHAENGQDGHSTSASPIEKEMLSSMKSPLPAKPHGQFRGHYPQASQDSHSSMAILMGRMHKDKDKSGLSRKASNDSLRSSTSSLHKQFKSKISKPIPQVTNYPALAAQDDRGVAFDPAVPAPRPRNNRPVDPQDGTRRSSGWNRYWSGGSALQILGFGGQKRNTLISEPSSHYSEGTGTNNHASRVTQDSATVPPLNFDRALEGRPSVNSVNSGSPVVAQYSSKLPAEGMTGTIERPVSPVSSGYSSGIPESINDTWDPMEGRSWGADRAPSSAYTASYHYGASLTPSAAAAGSRQPPSGVSKQPQLAMAATSSDMSWLNLGDQSRARGT